MKVLLQHLIPGGALVLVLMAGSGQLLGQTCNLYVATNGQAGNNGSQNAPFANLNDAEIYLENPNNGYVTVKQVTVASPITHVSVTFNTYNLNRPTTVCVMPGDYHAADYSPSYALAPTITQPNSPEDKNVEIKISGTAANPLIFRGIYQQGVGSPTIHQSGYAGIEIESTANWVTVTGFGVEGQNYNANSYSNATARIINSQTAGWGWFDGSCLSVKGGAGGDQKGDSGANNVNPSQPFPPVTPTHITLSNNTIYACGGAGIAAIEADYLTISNNNIHDNAWYSMYGASGISIQSSYPSDNNTSTPKIVLENNYSYDNKEFVPWQGASPSPMITDGEGIIIDSNNHFNYGGLVLVANNVVTLNGSAGIEVFASQNTTVLNNSTYSNNYYSNGIPQNNDITGRPELFVNQAGDHIIVENNIFAGKLPLGGGGLTGNNNYFNNNVYYSTTGTYPSPATAGGALGANVYSGGNEAFGTITPAFKNPTPPNGGTPDLGLVTGNAALYSGYNGYPNLPPTDIAGDPQPSATYHASGAYVGPNE